MLCASFFRGNFTRAYATHRISREYAKRGNVFKQTHVFHSIGLCVCSVSAVRVLGISLSVWIVNFSVLDKEIRRAGDKLLFKLVLLIRNALGVNHSPHLFFVVSFQLSASIRDMCISSTVRNAMRANEKVLWTIFYWFSVCVYWKRCKFLIKCQLCPTAAIVIAESFSTIESIWYFCTQRFVT